MIVWAILLQLHNEMLKPIAFASRLLTSTEHHYTTSERELLAITFAYDQFYSHVFGRHITFYTDHEPLVTMRHLKFANMDHKRLARLFHRLQDVDYELKYIPGSENYLADFLSRAFAKEDIVAESHSLELNSNVNWAVEQGKCNDIASVIDLLVRDAQERSWLPLPNGRRWFSERRHLFVSPRGILMHGKNRIVCPPHMYSEVLRQHHDTPFAGHRAFETTFESVKLRFFWLFMSTFIKQYCKSCAKCQTFNYACLHPRAPLLPIQVTKPWQLVGTDFMGPFKCSMKGNRYIILAVDHLTKFAEGAATVSFDAKTTAEFLFNNIVCRYGMFQKLLSDQGVNFESNLIKHLCILLGTDKLHTTTYHPAGNGITERLNKTIKPALAKFVNFSHDDWDTFLPMALSAYDNSFHSTIKMTPFEAQFHRHSIQVSDVIMNNQLPFGTKPSDVAEFTHQLRRSAHHINRMLLENTAVAQHRQKQYYDKFVRDKETFNIGDTVKIKNFQHRTGLSKSFEQKFLGPYTVTDKTSELSYNLQSPLLPPQQVHYNRILKYRQRTATVTNEAQAPAVSIVAPHQEQHHRQSFSQEQSASCGHFCYILAPSRLYLEHRAEIAAANAAGAAIVAADEAAATEAAAAVVATDEAAAAEDAAFVIAADEVAADDALTTAAAASTSVSATDATPSATAVDEDILTTAVKSLTMQNGKPAVACANCGQICEAKIGLTTHMRSCKTTPSPTTLP